MANDATNHYRYRLATNTPRFTFLSYSNLTGAIMRSFENCFGIAVQPIAPTFAEMLLPEFGGDYHSLFVACAMGYLATPVSGGLLRAEQLGDAAELVVYSVGGDSGHTKIFRPAPQKDYAIRGGKLVDDNPRNGGKGKVSRAKTRKTAKLPNWLERHPTRGVSATQARLDAMQAFYATHSALFDNDDGPSFEGGERYTPPAGEVDYTEIRRGRLSVAPQQAFGGSRDVGDGV